MRALGDDHWHVHVISSRFHIMLHLGDATCSSLGLKLVMPGSFKNFRNNGPDRQESGERRGEVKPASLCNEHLQGATSCDKYVRLHQHSNGHREHRVVLCQATTLCTHYHACTSDTCRQAHSPSAASCHFSDSLPV